MAIQLSDLRILKRRGVTLFPLLAITVALGCVLALFNAGPADSLPRKDPQRSLNASLSSTPIFNGASGEASRHVDDYLQSVDTAMANGLAVLRGGDGKSISAQSRYFNALVNAGYAQFGSSYYDPLGSCGVAGSSARHLWHTQIRAVSGEANIASEVGKARAALQRDRQSCLDAVRQTSYEAMDWAPSELASLNLAPTWTTAGKWPESAAGSSATNL